MKPKKHVRKLVALLLCLLLLLVNSGSFNILYADPASDIILEEPKMNADEDRQYIITDDIVPEEETFAEEPSQDSSYGSSEMPTDGNIPLPEEINPDVLDDKQENETGGSAEEPDNEMLDFVSVEISPAGSDESISYQTTETAESQEKLTENRSEEFFGSEPEQNPDTAERLDSNHENKIDPVTEAGENWNSLPINAQASTEGVTMSVSAPEGSFPDGTVLEIQPYDTDQVWNLLQQIGVGSEAAAFDISFYKEGNKVHPREGYLVNLSISIASGSGLSYTGETKEILHVYHISDNYEIDELVCFELSEQDTVEINIQTDRFSPYVIVKEVTKEDKKETVRARSVTSTNLADFLVRVDINAPTDENGNYIIDPNCPYELTLSFSENEGVQFDDESMLFYNLPEGVLINDIGAAAFSLTIVDENGTASISDNIFEIVDGQLRIYFNQNDPNFDRLKAMSNVNFDISIAAFFDQTVGEIVFNPNIIKEFVYGETSDLSIQKSVVYNMHTDTAYYELQIRSEGLNENVVIEDRLTGTALNFNRDVVIESNVNGTLSVTPDYTAVENGYRVTIPQTVHGEVLTLRYSAAVDNTKISSNGTVEQTNNTARVSSDQVPDGKEDSAHFAGQADFQRIAKRASGEPVQVGENLYRQTWTIRVNEDHKMSMGGADIDDWILRNSRPFMQFDGEGLIIKVTFENGETETRTVPWSDLYLWQDDGGIWGWKYTTPESDGRASYEISCTTLINTTGALGNLTLENGAQVYNSYDEGKVTIGQIGESDFGIRKDAVGTTSTESEWAITVTVPGSGLSDLRVVDDAPKLAYEGQDYIDHFIEDSFEIEGLLEGESWSFGLSSDQRSYTVTFYKSGTQSDADKGVLPTPDGEPRNIVIRFKTEVNQDWLNLASQDGYATSNLYRHRNYACAWSGSYRTETVDASVVPIKPDLAKDFVERSDAEIDGVTYPVFRYTLTLLGPVEDGIVIRDSFNTEYLKFYEAVGVQIRGWSNSTPADENGSASAVDVSDGMDITISSFPKQGNGSFYPYYLVSYSLIAKDADALSALNADAAASQNGIDLDNTARWDTLESSSTANYTYFPYVDKELLTQPTSENGYVAEFEVVINKYAEDLDPASDVLNVQDELSSNLRFIPDSLTITPANDSITIQHDSATNTLMFTEVPDETTFVIRYQARVLGIGNVTYSNTVKFGNYEKTIEETTTVDSSGGGTGSNPSITLVKRDADMLSVTLAGAIFQLFYLENENQIPVKDKNGQNVTFTTGADGRVLLVGNLQNLGWTLWAGRTYCLVEMAPPDGYELNNEPVYFILTEHPSSQIEFDITGDQLSVQNEAIKISVPVSKTWIGPAAESLTVTLTANGTVKESFVLNEENSWKHTFTGLLKYDSTTGEEIVYDVTEADLENYQGQKEGSAAEGFTFTNTNTETINIPVGKTWIGPAAESLTVTLTADNVVQQTATLTEATGWSYTFTGLTKYDSTDGHEIVYDVTEADLENYQGQKEGSAAEGFTFTNTNTETINIPVEKTWVGPAAESLTVTLTANGTVKETFVLNEENSWKHTFTGLLKYDSTTGEEIVYDVTEADLENYQGQKEGSVAEGFTFTNTNTETINIPVEKKWVGGEENKVTIRLYADGNEIQTKTIRKSSGWKTNFNDLPKYDKADGHKITYHISEDSIEGYSSTVQGNSDIGFIVTNTKNDDPRKNKPGEPPKTGDINNPALWFALILLSEIILFLAFRVLVREKKNREK